MAGAVWERYVIETEDGNWSAEFDWLDDAVEVARQSRKRGEKCAVLAVIYEYSDTELVDPDLETWPPDGRATYIRT